MDERFVSSQEEYDALPADYKGRIVVTGDAIVEVRGAAIVEVCDCAAVSAYDSAIVTAYNSSRVCAYGSSKVIAYNSSFIRAYDHSIVTSYDSSIVIAYNCSTIRAYGTSMVKAVDLTIINSYDLSTVIANGGSLVYAYGSSRVMNFNHNKTILGGLAREVALPANIEEYSNWYNIPIIDGKIKLYKAVHKFNKGEKSDYYSDYDPHFRYSIGKNYEIDCNEDIDIKCGYGLHAAHLDWAINYGREWADAAILEVEVPIECIVVPRGTDGKIRTSKLKVLRELPREEW